MVSADGSRPGAGSGKVDGKAERPPRKTEKTKAAKADKARRKPGQTSEPKPDVLPDAPEALRQALQQAEPPVVSTENLPALTAASDPAPRPPAEPALPAAPAPVSVSTITDAYGSYTRKSIEQTTSFFAELAGTRSLNRAFDLQTDFARQSFETFVAESRRIRELHRELAKQRLSSLEGLVMGKRATRLS